MFSIKDSLPPFLIALYCLLSFLLEISECTSVLNYLILCLIPKKVDMSDI